jgi:Tol biopolymer transport system component/DNA-binding winged helix-turn-helix (wHTH) protein
MNSSGHKTEAAGNGNSKRVTFDHFELDLRSGEIRKDGTKIRLQAKPFRLLALLLERPGELVTREEVCRALWNAETFVDFDHSLGTAINKIREALGDSAGQPRFVETLPKRGYRFIGAVASPDTEIPLPKIGTVGPRKKWVGVVVILGTVLCLLVAVFGYRWLRYRLPQEPRVFRSYPFTSFPGVETAPAFSPDGSRIAFAWDGGGGTSTAGSANTASVEGFDLYVKAIGSETLLRLTNSPSEWISPTWSPDGTQIAFHRLAGADTGIYVVPALGGPERKLRSTRIPYAVAAPISWSPDGKWIAFGDPLPNEASDRIFLLSLDSLETRRIPRDESCLHEGEATFSHDGKRLAYICVRNLNDFAVNTVLLSGGTPRTVVQFRAFPQALAWSVDDKKLILSKLVWSSFELDEVSVEDGSTQKIGLADSVQWFAISSRGERLAYSDPSNNTNVWRKDLLNPKAPTVKVISSTRQQQNAKYSPDGTHIAFESSRGGVQGVWISDAEGANLVQISNAHDESGSPDWSPDGKKIAFDSVGSGHLEIYVTDVSERVPRKLVTNISEIYRPRWSRDGKWVYFQSFETGRAGIYRCREGGGDATAIYLHPDATDAQESTDGREVYFAARATKPQLKKLALNSLANAETMVEGFPGSSDSSLWTLRPEGVYFVPANAPRSLCYFEFATKRTRTIFAIGKDFDQGLSVSPDGRWILYSQVDEVNSDIMLIEGFRDAGKGVGLRETVRAWGERLH